MVQIGGSDSAIDNSTDDTMAAVLARLAQKAAEVAKPLLDTIAQVDPVKPESNLEQVRNSFTVPGSPTLDLKTLAADLFETGTKIEKERLAATPNPARGTADSSSSLGEKASTSDQTNNDTSVATVWSAMGAAVTQAKDFATNKLEAAGVSPEQLKTQQLKAFLSSARNITSAQVATEALVKADNFTKGLPKEAREAAFNSVLSALQLAQNNPAALIGSPVSVALVVANNMSSESKAAASLLASLPNGTQEEQDKFKETVESLVGLSKNPAGSQESKFMNIAKDAIQKLPVAEQQKILSDVLSHNTNFTDTKQRDAFANVLANLPDGKSASDLTGKILSIGKGENKNSQTLATITNHLAGLRQGQANTPELKAQHQQLLTDLLTAGGASKETAESAAKLLTSLSNSTPDKEANLKNTAEKLAKLDPKSRDVEAQFIGITKDALTADGLSSDKQTKVLSDLLTSNSALKSNTLQRDAFANVLAKLPDGKSAEELVKKISAIDPKSSPESKNAETLAVISNHLAELRQIVHSPELKDQHQDLVANLMNANGVPYPAANIAAKALDYIGKNDKANAIQLAMGLANEQAKNSANDPAKTFLSADATKLAQISGLSLEQAQKAKTDIAKAGVRLLQEAGMDTDRVARTLDSLVDKNGNLDNNKMAGVVAALVRSGAPAQGASWVNAQSWNPGYVNRPQGLFGLGNVIERPTHQAMNAAYNSNYFNLKSQLDPKASDISNLYNLFKASGMQMEQANTVPSQADLESLQSLGSKTQALADSSNPFRITQDRTTSDQNGNFNLFTDKVIGKEFYQLTKNGQEQYAIKDGDTWKFLQGNNLTYKDKSYADTIRSFKESQALANQPKIQSQIAKKDDHYKHYQAQDGKYIILYQGNDPRYQNLAFERTSDGSDKPLSAKEVQAYQKAVSSWGSQVNRSIPSDTDANGKYNIYTLNDGSKVAVGTTQDTKGITFTQTKQESEKDPAQRKWTQYQERQVVSQNQQYQSSQPQTQQVQQYYPQQGQMQQSGSRVNSRQQTRDTFLTPKGLRNYRN